MTVCHCFNRPIKDEFSNGIIIIMNNNLYCIFRALSLALIEPTLEPPSILSVYSWWKSRRPVFQPKAVTRSFDTALVWHTCQAFQEFLPRPMRLTDVQGGRHFEEHTLGIAHVSYEYLWHLLKFSLVKYNQNI